jgi:NDP-sugar pyrophosphorylase family protein
MIDNNEKITAMKIKQKWFDIGTPQRYLDALNYSFKVKH